MLHQQQYRAGNLARQHLRQHPPNILPLPGHFVNAHRKGRLNMVRANNVEHDDVSRLPSGEQHQQPVAGKEAVTEKPQQQQQQQQRQQQAGGPPQQPQQQQYAADSQQQQPQQPQLVQPAVPQPDKRVAPAGQPSPAEQQQQQVAAGQQQVQQRQQQQQQQQQQLMQRVLQIVKGLQQTPSTLVAFLLGGLGSCLLLYGWAKGNPLRRHQPYSFSMMFAEASKIDCGTPVRMKGVQIGLIAAVKLYPSHVEAVAQVMDSANVIPRSARVDINLLGLAADPWIDITPSPDSTVRRDHGPHHPECLTDGLIVCHNGVIDGYQGGSTDYMMKFFLSQHDRTRVKAVRV